MTIEQEIKQKEILTAAHRDYEKGLSTYAFYKLRNKAICEDLVQDTFMKAWSYIVKGGKIEKMKAFLYHILNNLIIDQYRRHKTSSLDVLLEKGFEPSAEDTGQIFNIIDGKAVLKLVQSLPKTYQKVIRMRYVEDLSLTEMSRNIGKSRNTVAVQAHRGLEKLRLLYNAS